MSGDAEFDSAGRVANHGQATFSAGGEYDLVVNLLNAALFEYDVLGRTTKMLEPNQAETTLEYGFGTTVYTISLPRLPFTSRATSGCRL